MPYSCSVMGCSNTPDVHRGIGVHKLPSADDQRPQVRKRRKLWVDFLNTKRKCYTITSHSRVCSVHFSPEDFEKRYCSLSGTQPSFPKLLRDKFGVIGIPKFQTAAVASPVTERSWRRVSISICQFCST